MLLELLVQNGKRNSFEPSLEALLHIGSLPPLLEEEGKYEDLKVADM